MVWKESSKSNIYEDVGKSDLVEISRFFPNLAPKVVCHLFLKVKIMVKCCFFEICWPKISPMVKELNRGNSYNQPVPVLMEGYSQGLVQHCLNTAGISFVVADT